MDVCALIGNNGFVPVFTLYERNKEMGKPKFKVGDWVTMLVPEEFFERIEVTAHILEVNQQICEAEIEQTTYITRLFTKSSDLKAKREAVTLEQIRVREMELGSKIKELKEE